ncbi:MAG TPA: KTSC domain-containing protein [Sphingomonas sp.]|uniref:KTSC domain-containing protein n=1 Tax=Sphingomonas sp. TaxID=28214 RepID=UPI002EDAE73D
MIHSHSYDATRRQLTIRFTSGRVYSYQDVPPEIATALDAAESPGGVFNTQIRDRFDHVRRR